MTDDKWWFSYTQVLAGVMLILMERFDFDDEDHELWNDRMNTGVVCLIFVILVLNIFISSLGVDVANPFSDMNKGKHPSNTQGLPTLPTAISGL